MTDQSPGQPAISGEQQIAEWLEAHAGVVLAGIQQGDLCSRDFDREDVRKIRTGVALIAALQARLGQEQIQRRKEVAALTEERDTLRQQIEEALTLARQAVNGWACHARRDIEHNEIARLHKRIDVLAEAP